MRLEMLLVGTAARRQDQGDEKMHAIEVTKQPGEPGGAGGRGVQHRRRAKPRSVMRRCPPPREARP